MVEISFLSNDSYYNALFLSCYSSLFAAKWFWLCSVPFEHCNYFFSSPLEMFPLVRPCLIYYIGRGLLWILSPRWASFLKSAHCNTCLPLCSKGSESHTVYFLRRTKVFRDGRTHRDPLKSTPSFYPWERKGGSEQLNELPKSVLINFLKPGVHFLATWVKNTFFIILYMPFPSNTLFK